MRFWLKALVGVLVLVFVLLVAAALFVAQLDPNDYRSNLSDLVHSATGRALHIGGNLRVKLLPNPTLEVDDVALANVDWASAPDMLRIERLQVEILLAPLLQGAVVVQRLVAIAPQISLETDAAGRNNWTFGGVEQTPTQDTRRSESRAMAVVLNQIHIEKGALDYFDGESGKRTHLRLDGLELGARQPGGPLDLDLRAGLQELSINIEGSIGAAQTMLDNEPFPVDIKGSLGDAAFTLEGRIGRPLDADDLDLELTSSIPATRSLTDAIGIDAEELGPVEVAAKLAGGARRLSLDPFSISAKPRATEARLEGSITELGPQHFSSSDAAGSHPPMHLDVDGRLGDARVHLQGVAGNLVTASNVQLAVRAEAPSTRPLSKLAGIELEELGPVDLSFDLAGEDGRLSLDDIALSARPRGSDATLSGTIRNVVLGSGDKDAEPAKVDLKGTFAEARFEASGDVGKPLRGRDVRLRVTLAAQSTRPLTKIAGIDIEELGPVDAGMTVVDKDGRLDLESIDVNARPRKANLEIKGAIADVAGSLRPDLKLALSAESLRQLGERLPAAGPVEVSARVEPKQELIEIHDLVARIGNSDLSGSVTLKMDGKRPSARARLRSGLLDLPELLATSAQSAPEPPAEKQSGAEQSAAEQSAAEQSGAEQSGAEQSGAQSRAQSSASKRVFSDAPLPFELLKKADADVELAVDRLKTRKLAFEKFDLSASLDDGNFTVKPAGHVAGGRFEATIGIDSRAEPAAVSAQVDASSISISKLGEEMRGYETSQGLESNLRMKFTGRGKSVRAIMGDLDGQFALEIGEGRLKNDALNRVGADIFIQVFGSLVPTDEKESRTKVNCGVMRFNVVDGQAVADKTLVIQTDKVLMSGSGLVNLKTEQVDAGAVLQARKGIRIGAGTVSSMMRVRGTIANPQLGTDLTGVAKTGVRIGAAVFTAGLSLLAESLYGHVAEDAHPCRTAMERPIDMSPSELKRLFSLE